MEPTNPNTTIGARYQRALKHRRNVYVLDRSPRRAGMGAQYSQWAEIDPATIAPGFRARLWQIEDLSHCYRWVVVQPASDTGKFRIFVSDQPTFTLDN